MTLDPATGVAKVDRRDVTSIVGEAPDASTNKPSDTQPEGQGEDEFVDSLTAQAQSDLNTAAGLIRGPINPSPTASWDLYTRLQSILQNAASKVEQALIAATSGGQKRSKILLASLNTKIKSTLGFLANFLTDAKDTKNAHMADSKETGKLSHPTS